MNSQPAVNKWVVTISIAFGSLMAAIDSSIVNVAIPNIRGSVGATVEEIAWINTAYIISMVLVMPLTGLLGALFGQRRLYLSSLVLFIGGSVLCGLARSLPALVLYRILQGLGAGSLQPSQQAIMRQTFPPNEQGMAMAVFSMVIMLGPAVGPTLGGWITDNFSWPWIFFINLPVGIVGVFMTWKNVHDSEDIRLANLARAADLKKNMDWLGIALLIIGVSTLQYFLEEGPSKDWFESNAILVTAVIATVSILAFIIHELSFSHPVINLKLFRDRTFTSGSIVAAIVFAVLMGSLFLLPVFMQELLGFNATQSGLTLMPRSLAMLVVTPFVGKLYNKISPVLIIAFGTLSYVVGSFMLSTITLQSGTGDIILPLIITGVGLACLMIPLNTVALSFIPRENLADAAGLNSFMRQIGGSIGLTVFATLLSRYGTRAAAAMAANVTNLRAEVQLQYQHLIASLMPRVHDLNLAHAYAVKILHGKTLLQGMVIAFDKLFILQGILFIALLPLLLFIKVERNKPTEHIELGME